MDIALQQIIETVYEAGAVIMHYFRSVHLQVEQKKDESPLTIADREANSILTHMLERYSGHPVVSEENAMLPYEERCRWHKFWLVDPLDGTKSFIRGEETFTVNVALIKGQLPVMGLLYAPAYDTLYYAVQGQGAFRVQQRGQAQPLKRPPMPPYLTALISKSHRGNQDKELLRGLPVKHFVPLSSALKFARVAEGKAHIYVRTGPTMEWDTAAGQAIVEEVGGVVLDLQGNPLIYNKKEMRNDGFVCKLYPELQTYSPAKK
ncbi:3'(2'),5'-bisphosphate nucleotidase CysQ [Thermonema rossianum]|jgi:3'(2'), 5'-bisphosphate nucleotidase|uniref:3'(2'),5'-bisphosphate nucleotidase CysQ n=1 Tax=Thermonema rossianum TaxID=55505 RepID=UPI00057034CA|nr:3'(2'),5'-bisphosphate nucleotidase CysQ [Thermonema rossianum]